MEQGAGDATGCKACLAIGKKDAGGIGATRAGGDIYLENLTALESAKPKRVRTAPITLVSEMRPGKRSRKFSRERILVNISGTWVA